MPLRKRSLSATHAAASMRKRRSPNASTSRNISVVDLGGDKPKDKPKRLSKTYLTQFPDDICIMCYKHVELKEAIRCVGKVDEKTCPNVYHFKCIDRSAKENNYLCDECLEPKCYACRRGMTMASPLLPCKHAQCTKVYHVDCLAKRAKFCRTTDGARIVRAMITDIKDTQLILSPAIEPSLSLHLEAESPESEDDAEPEEVAVEHTDCNVLQQGNFICPRHLCATCEGKKSLFRIDVTRKERKLKKQEKFLYCVRCPNVFHATDDCIPAGSELMGDYGSRLISCPDHYEPPQRSARRRLNSKNFHVNVNWCMACAHPPDEVDKGKLVLCEKCPAAFHVKCIGRKRPPEGQYLCEDCSKGRRIVYGDILWARCGQYRWWPVRVVSPFDIPLNVQKLPHESGEFAVYYFGANNYGWTSRYRTFFMSPNDTMGNAVSGSKTMSKQCKEGFELAKKELAQRQKELEARALAEPDFQRIRTNKLSKKLKSTFVPACEGEGENDCDCSAEEACGESCTNRLLLIECNPKVCKAGDACQNMRMLKHQNAKVKYFRTGDGRGFGLRAEDDIAKDSFVIEYVGELIDHSEMEERLKTKHLLEDTDYYFLTLDNERIIDAGPMGNDARFMNNSCDPNCATQPWRVNGDKRIGLFALRDIKKGEELTFNYQLVCLGTVKLVCKCGAANCKGFIDGQAKAKSVETDPNDDVEPIGSKRKRPKKPRRVTPSKTMAVDPACSFCHKPDTDIICSVRNCPRSYHSSCCEQCGVQMPLRKGRFWRCPKHQCEMCMQPAVSLCDRCPNGYCAEHAEGNIAWLWARAENNEDAHSGFVCRIGGHGGFSKASIKQFLPLWLLKERGSSVAASKSLQSDDHVAEAPSATSTLTKSLKDNVKPSPCDKLSDDEKPLVKMAATRKRTISARKRHKAKGTRASRSALIELTTKTKAADGPSLRRRRPTSAAVGAATPAVEA